MENCSTHISKQLDHLKDKIIFVAVSGGVDSIVLLYALKRSGFETRAIHVNYQLRGAESNEDAQFVEEFCSQNHIPCLIKTIDLNKELESGGNLQEKARAFRYQWFNDILQENTNHRIALGHHLDDQIETFYLNLARKSGVMGLACMLPENNGIVRPMLQLNKSSIIDFAKREQLSWRDDSSNQSLKYSRNKLRNEILPAVQKEIPSLSESVNLLIKHFQSLQNDLTNSVCEILTKTKDVGRLSSNDFASMNALQKVELFRLLGLSSGILNQVEKLQTKGSFVQLEGNNELERIVKEVDGFTFVLKGPIEKKPSLIISKCAKLPTSFDKTKLYLDAEKITGELTLRKWLVGDRIDPIGVKGSTLISDVLSDAKLSYREKQETYVLLNNETLLWCVGKKISKHALATPSSQSIICVEVIY